MKESGIKGAARRDIPTENYLIFFPQFSIFHVSTVFMAFSFST